MGEVKAQKCCVRSRWQSVRMRGETQSTCIVECLVRWGVSQGKVTRRGAFGVFLGVVCGVEDLGFVEC